MSAGADARLKEVVGSSGDVQACQLQEEMIEDQCAGTFAGVGAGLLNQSHFSCSGCATRTHLAQGGRQEIVQLLLNLQALARRIARAAFGRDGSVPFFEREI